MVIFVSAFFLLYGGVNLYVGWRLFAALQSLTWFAPLPFWLLYALLAWSPVVARIGSSSARIHIPKCFIRIGDYWMATVYYLFLAWATLDLLRSVSLFLPNVSAVVPENSPYLALVLSIGLLLLLTVGTLNAQKVKIRHYNVLLNKQVPDARTVKAVLVSDVHLGRTIGIRRLEKLIAQVNSLAPDVVFLAGDIIDGDAEYYARRNMDRLLAELSARYGVYAVMGNHEYLGGEGDLAAEQLRRAGIVVLRDEYTTVPGLFTIIGRDDRMANRFTGKPRKQLEEVMQGIDRSLPTILLDHQPYDLKDAVSSNVDLQVSGHTHYGQFFPNNFITGHIFEQDWGYLRKANLQVIVSCGYGTWGPPIRIGSNSEIVTINLTFSA